MKKSNNIFCLVNSCHVIPKKKNPKKAHFIITKTTFDWWAENILMVTCTFPVEITQKTVICTVSLPDRNILLLTVDICLLSDTRLYFGLAAQNKLPAGSLWLLQIWDSLFNLTFILSSTSLLHFNSPCFILYECWWLQQCLFVCFLKKQMDPKDKKKNWIMRFCKMSFLKSTMENKIATLLLCIYGFTTSQEKQESSRSDVLWHRFWSVWVALERQEIHVCVFKT